MLLKKKIFIFIQYKVTKIKQAIKSQEINIKINKKNGRKQNINFKRAIY